MSQETLSHISGDDVHEMALELEKFRQIVETAHDAVVTINDRHEVVFMNHAAEEMFGYRREEILGGDLLPLIPPEHRSRHRHYVERYVRTRQARMIGHVAQVEVERKNGERLPISISFSVAETGAGLLMTAIMRDRSEERELARQVKRAEALAAVGQMVATVSHEIKTPLVLIGGFATQLKKEPRLTPGGRRKLEIITEEVARLERMLLELGDLARPQRYDWQEIDLGEVAAHVKQLMTPELKKGRFKLKFHKAHRLPKVMADRHKLSQVLINLVNNAIQASVPGDELEMVLGVNDDGDPWLEVRDSGSGISESAKAELFTPFFTTKKRGTGLGLPVARRIVEEHGGSIEIQSEEGQGTTVRIIIPHSLGTSGAPPGVPPVV